MTAKPLTTERERSEALCRLMVLLPEVPSADLKLVALALALDDARTKIAELERACAEMLPVETRRALEAHVGALTAALRQVQAEWKERDVSAPQAEILRGIDEALDGPPVGCLTGSGERLRKRIGTLEAALRELCAVCNLPASNKALEAARAVLADSDPELPSPEDLKAQRDSARAGAANAHENWRYAVKERDALRAEVERIEQGYKARVYERDQAIASRDRFRNEAERMRPVVEAAQTWADDGEDTSFNLQRAVDAYRAEEKK